MEGIFAIYKEKGPTSNDVLTEIKKVLHPLGSSQDNRNQSKRKRLKIGHAGTLDPLARGVLVVGIGKEYTKKLSQIVKKEKEYIAKIRLGVESTTDDEEGNKKICKVVNIPPLKIIKEELKKFEGEISQKPPIYSAVKVKGKEAYKWAREASFEPLMESLKARKVTIKKIDILDYKWPFLKLRVVTGPGVYIRSLARDLGKNLGVGGYLADLERVRVGEYTKKDSYTLDKFFSLI